MKILCCTYRDWANQIYKVLEYHFKEHEFIIIDSKEKLSYQDIEAQNPDLILWYGWSWIIPKKILDKYYSVMLHPSPLPKYRGGSPIQNQIINGEKESAITLFKMNGGIDTGGIIFQEAFQLQGGIQSIFQTITSIGIKLSKVMIENFSTLVLTPQDESKATYYKRRTPDQSEITIDEICNSTAEELHNKVRCLQNPYPNAFIRCKDGTKLYITDSHL